MTALHHCLTPRPPGAISARRVPLGLATLLAHRNPSRKFAVVAEDARSCPIPATHLRPEDRRVGREAVIQSEKSRREPIFR